MSHVGCSKTLKTFESIPTNDLDKQNDIIEILKNKKCANEHKEDVREIDFDSVYFGRYEQDGIVENGKEDIEWIILDKDFEKNEVLLISKYALDFIQFADNYDNLSQQEKDEYINSCPDKSIVDLMKLSNEFAASNFGRYCKYEQTNLYKYLTNTFYEEAFDEKEKSFLLNNSQVIREKVYNNLKIMVPTKDDLNKYFLNDFQRLLYGTHEYIDKNNRMKSISTYNEELSSINENLFYVYIDDSSNLRLVVDGELNENHDYRLIYKANIRPMIRLCINDLIKNYSNNNNKVVKHIINNKENEKVSNFIKEKRIKLDGTYELYKEPIFNVYTELKNYINHNRSTGKKYGTFGYDYYEIKWDNDKQTIELSYKLVDMDNDGCKELVIFNNDRLLELYTIYKNTLRHLYSSVRGSTLGHSYENYITEDNKLLTHYEDGIGKYYKYYGLTKGLLYEEISYSLANDWNDGSDSYKCKDYVHNKVYMTNTKDRKKRVSNNNVNKNVSNNEERETVISIPYDYKEGIKLAKTVIDPDNEYLESFADIDYGRYDYDIVTFGKYYDYNDEKTNLKWIVLDKNEDKALLLCEDVINCKCFDDTNVKTTYKNSSIRKWLNEEFYNEAFSNSEKMNIIDTNNINIDLQGNKQDDTIDKVFLLSLYEVQTYFGELDNIDENNSYKHIVHNNRAQAFPTQYAKKIDNLGEKLFYSKAEDRDYGGACEWWLRTMNDDNKSAAIVYCNGYAEGLEKEHLINYKNRGVRPAIWVKCNE